MCHPVGLGISLKCPTLPAMRMFDFPLADFQNGKRFKPQDATLDDPSAMVSRTRVSASFQWGKVTPKVSSSRWQDKRELAGRLAGRGNSLVLIGIRFGTVNPKVPDDSVNRASANPNQDVSPEEVR